MEQKNQLPLENIQTTTPPTSPASKTNNWLLIGLGILLILSLGSTGFLFYQNAQLKKQIAQLQVKPTPVVSPSPIIAPSPTPTPDLIADWKIYTNSEYGYKVKYPSAWHLYQPEVKTAGSKDTVGFWPEKGEEEVLGIWVTVRGDGFSYTDLNSWWIEYKKRMLTPLDVYAIEEKKALEENFDEWIEVKNLTIAGQPALRVETKSGYPSRPYRSVFVIDRNNEIIEIYTNIADSNNPHFEVFDQILSTFEFIR